MGPFGADPLTPGCLGARSKRWLGGEARTCSRGALETFEVSGYWEPVPEQSIQKLVNARQGQEIASFAMDLLGEVGLLQNDVLGDRWKLVEKSCWMGSAMRVTGGTDKVIRNIIAERVLSLPGDVRIDKNVAFNQIAKERTR